jgi:hypothetical protein
MKKNFFPPVTVIALTLITFILPQCNQKESKPGISQSNQDAATTNNGGFASQAEWGRHLTILGGCNDCHTPKMMTSTGPQLDTSSLLSGHPSKMPPPDVNRKEMESKGLAVTQTLTSWVGPWGISYAANITSDSTGIGNWTEDQFILCLREGKFKGLPDSRQLLPPMPWQDYKYLKDDELKAIFAYLKSTKPVKNVVPAAAPPVLASKE